MSTESPYSIVIVTGVSGAGLSSTLHQLEDFGYEAIDNLPIRLISTVMKGRVRPMALGLDVRNRDFKPEEILQNIAHFRQTNNVSVWLIFLDCNDDELITRYNKTKRAHPFGNNARLNESIAQERELLSSLRNAADFILDTTGQSIWQHQERLRGLGIKLPQEQLRIRLISFSYARGIPRDADLVFDVRFLQNPHYEKALQPLNGTDKKVMEFVASDQDYDTYFDTLTSLLSLTLMRYQQEGKSYLTIAVGCTGGQHRSVAVCEALGKWVKSHQHHLQIFHREFR